MKLIKIPEDKYYEYRLQAMFDCYKWDPQFCDSNTLARHVLVLSEKENEEHAGYYARMSELPKDRFVCRGYSGLN